MNKKRLLIFLLLILAVLAAGICIAVFTRVVIPSGTEEMIAAYTRNKPDAELTVAVITPKGTEIKAYGHDGKRISVPDRYYEIGDITKTFTGAIAAKAIVDGRLSPNEEALSLLPLARSAYNPSVFELLTHSSAYSTYAPDIRKLASGNPYTGIDANALVAQMNSFKLAYKPPYLYSYSNFGAAAAGAVISSVYDVDYYSILTIFAQEELGLKHTFVATEKSVPNGWVWDSSDAYIASLGLTSTIGDMVAYAKLYLNEEYDFLALAADQMLEINAENDSGYLWNISDKGRVISHAGETGHYASQILIDRTNGNAVIVLSNYGNDRFGSVSDIAAAVFKDINI